MGSVLWRSPSVLISVLVAKTSKSGGTSTTVELRNAWQRAWAQYRTSQSPIDYVRVSGMGVDPMLVNAAQISRPGRGWWRMLLDQYGAADVVVPEVHLKRTYPGGPAKSSGLAPIRAAAPRRCWSFPCF